MATFVFFHAHPDDESIATGGTICRVVDEGHRAVLVFATRGECGEVADGFLDDDESLGERRVAETLTSAEVLGAHRVHFLGYHDSGMMGEPTNERSDCFWQADVGEAADRLSALLDDEQADVLTVYDDHGGYGHPDHIQVHRVGHEAARRAGTPHVLESTMNRDQLRLQIEQAIEAGLIPPDAVPDVDEGGTFGSPEHIITTRVDVTSYVERKRSSMRAHASQIPDDSFFVTMPDEAFAGSFGIEWYIRHGADPAHKDDWLLPT